MNSIVLIIIAAIVTVLIVSIIAHRLGFRLTKLKAKLGIVEAEMTRMPDPGTKKGGKETSESDGTAFSQEAADGGVVRKSTIKAPAGSPANASQRSDGQGSRIDDSHIEIK